MDKELKSWVGRPRVTCWAGLVSLCVIIGCDDTQSVVGDIAGGEVQAGDPAGVGAGASAGEQGGSGGEGGEGGSVPLGPPPHLSAPKAMLFNLDPIIEDYTRTEVELTTTTHEDGRLTSRAVEVFNCLNEPGGVSFETDIGLEEPLRVSLCREEQVARPDQDGHYLSVRPSSPTSDPNDSFAELMMYYHVNRAYEYYLTQHDYARYEEPLKAVVNVQLTTNYPEYYLDEPNSDGYFSVENAAFVAEWEGELTSEVSDVFKRDRDMIVFFQGASVDYAYDASVIYHEYAHAMVGIERLRYMALDEHGVDPSPRALNEGIADYFAASPLNQSVVGRYGLNSTSRDLATQYTCPRDMIWEPHRFGRVIGSALWALRERLGAVLTDRLVFDAMLLFHSSTTYQEASELLLAQAELTSSEALEATRAVLTEHGLLDCVRSLPWETFSSFTSNTGYPFMVGSLVDAGLEGFRATGAPDYYQRHVDLPEGAEGVELAWWIESEVAAPPSSLSLAYRRGALVEFRYDPLELIMDGKVRPPSVSQVQRVVFARRCFINPEGGDAPERLHMIFLNHSARSVLVPRLSIEPLESLEGLTQVETCEPPPPEAGTEAGTEAGAEAGTEAGTEAGAEAGAAP